MIFWITLIIGSLFGFLGLKKGVYIMYSILFNLLISMFISILTSPMVIQSTPHLETGYYGAFSLILLTVICFLILQGIAFYLFLRGADFIFPLFFDKIGGVVCGFLVGYLTTAVLALAFCMTPISLHEDVQSFLPSKSVDSFSRDTAVKSCGFIGKISFEYLGTDVNDALDFLITLNDPKAHQELLEKRNPKEESLETDFEIKSIPEPPKTETPAELFEDLKPVEPNTT